MYPQNISAWQTVPISVRSPKKIIKNKNNHRCMKDPTERKDLHQVSVVRSEHWTLEPEWIGRFLVRRSARHLWR